MFYFSKTSYVINCQHYKKSCETCFNFIHPVKYPIKYFAFAKENQKFYSTG